MAMLPLLALLFLFQDKPPEKCSISGTVVDSATGEPLSKVTLRLVPVDREAAAAATTSDAKGHFALVDIDSGAYRLIGGRSGYLEMYYGAGRPGSNGTILRLEAGRTLSDLKFKLTPSGALGGTIRDSDGEPIESASVNLGRISYNNRGRSRVERTASVSSDDRGEYRFHGLSPGKYYISAVYRQSGYFGEVDRSASTGPTEASGTTFYPGVPDTSAALPVEISAGARVAGIDVTLLRRRLVCVSGRVAMPPRTGRLIIELEGANVGMGDCRATTSARSAAGDFQFCRVPSGSYALSAYFETSSARVPVGVGPVDVKDIRLTLSPKANIQGQVLAEGLEKPNLRDVQFQISRDGKAETWGHALEDGQFKISALHPDRYDVAISATPAGFYVKSIRSGETDVLADGLTISGSGTVPVKVVISPDGAQLTGVVLDKDRQPVGGATVLLAPDQRSRFDLFKNTTTDQRGHYEFPALAPGGYKLFAWDDVELNEWNDPEFVKDYEKQAEKVALEPKAHATVNLRKAVPPDAR